MTESSSAKHFGPAWLLAGLVIVGVVIAFSETFVAMLSQWTGYEQYNHCLLIAPISAWLVWRRRHELASITPKVSGLGICAFVLCAGLWVLGTIGGIAVLQQFAAVGLIPMTIWALFGTATAWALAFPLGYLLFMIPFGSALIPILMTYTADMTVAVLKVTGIPIYHDGLYIAIPNGSFRIIEACSGIRMLLAGVAVGTV